jgi:D-aspartate ligase
VYSPRALTDPAPTLLTVADYCGTLAAARLLGDMGSRVTVADPNFMGPASWSRRVSRRLRCPAYAHIDRLIEWLLGFGAAEPGHVLYPTCDEYAWLIALHAEELGRHFRIYSPATEVIEALLDKRSLQELCTAVGIETPASWYPDGEHDLATIAAGASFPLLIKQRTQILSTSHTKGMLVPSPAELPGLYRDFARGNSFDAALLARRPGVALPLLQAYFPEASDGSLLVAGFIDRSGELFVARASNKLLQIPPRLGIALCLEPAPLPPDLADRIARLCRTAGYFGVFQMEFIRTQGRHLLIDFNPRYYHHLAFETARGMPLPLMAYLAACGRNDELAQEVRSAVVAPDPIPGPLFTHQTQLRAVLTLRRLSGRISRDEAAAWRARCGTGAVDAVRDPTDAAPALFDSLLLAADWGRSPISTYIRMTANA